MEKQKILLVDDDPDILEQTKIQLESKGYEVIIAESGKEGFEKFKKEKPAAAIVDLIMEEHDSGFILCYKIKQEKYGKNIPVFILTSATSLTSYKFGTTTKEEREWIHADEIFNKPVVADDLLKKLENYLTAKNAVQ